MKVGSICSGVGGLDLALESFGHEIVWQCEYDPYASEVLAKHWPEVPNYGDIWKVDWKEIDHMAAHRNDEKAEAMYDRYCQGLSLADVAEEFGVTGQSVFKMFRNRNLEMRARPPARPSIVFNGRRYSLRNNGYYGATEGNRASLHRDMWEASYGPIPADYDIHHKNFDKTDNRLDNFECLPKAEHAHLYGTGCNGFRHGCDREVMPNEEPAVDIIAAGYP